MTSTGTPRSSGSGEDPQLAALLLAFAAIYFIWGSTYLAIRFTIETMPPFWMTSVRFLIAGTMMYGWSRARGAPAPTRAQWKSGAVSGTLLGEKIVVTEFIAYQHLAEIANPGEEASEVMSARSVAIAAYALCGFANFASIAIQIGGLSVIAPAQRKQFVTLGLKAMIGGAMASWMTASIAGVFL